ncbi:MAG: ferritin [Chloroflexota bacterium]
MLSTKIQDAMNEQIKVELESAYIYLSMAAYCESLNLPGFAHWMQAQFQEELGHAMKFFGQLYDRGGRVVLQAIAQPQVDFESPLKVFEITLAHEQFVTSRINALYKLAVDEGDYASQIFLQWFVDEQVEEEKTASDVLEVLRRVGDKGHALVMVDRELARRGG